MRPLSVPAVSSTTASPIETRGVPATAIAWGAWADIGAGAGVAVQRQVQRLDRRRVGQPDATADRRGDGPRMIEKVFKEGRKFGVGAMIISQRPSEISETILAQVGTYIALRLTNSGDQSIVKASAPDNLISLIDLLPSLRTGEAIIVGEAIKIPSRVRVNLNIPRPTSDDPKLVEGWSKEHPANVDNYKEVVTAIREHKVRGK